MENELTELLNKLDELNVEELNLNREIDCYNGERYIDVIKPYNDYLKDYNKLEVKNGLKFVFASLVFVSSISFLPYFFVTGSGFVILNCVVTGISLNKVIKKNPLNLKRQKERVIECFKANDKIYDVRLADLNKRLIMICDKKVAIEEMICSLSSGESLITKEEIIYKPKRLCYINDNVTSYVD